jgi:hypothetical protein
MRQAEPVGVDIITGEPLYLLPDLFPSQEYNPCLPPGYYVAFSASDTRCAHCGAVYDDHIPREYHHNGNRHTWPACPTLPVEVLA